MGEKETHIVTKKDMPALLIFRSYINGPNNWQTSF